MNRTIKNIRMIECINILVSIENALYRNGGFLEWTKYLAGCAYWTLRIV